jgi:hypothetical protein
MTCNNLRQYSYKALAATVSASIALAGLAIFCTPFASAQGRNPGRGGGGSDSGRGSGGSDSGRGSGRSDSGTQRGTSSPSQPSRSESSGRHEEPRSSPSPRYEAPRREEYRPSSPQRSDSSPSRYGSRSESGYGASRGDSYSIPRRDTSSTSGQYGGNRGGEYRASGRDPLSYQNPRRGDDNAPRRDTSSPRSEPRTSPRDDSPRNNPSRDESTRGDQRPTRDPGSVRGDQTPRRDTTPSYPRTSDQSSGNVFSRRNPATRNDSSSDWRSDNQGSRRLPYGDRVQGPGPIRSGSPSYRTNSRSETVTPQHDRGRDIFTRSQEGRYYNNGVTLRHGYYTPYREVERYYPRYSYYPYYYPTFVASASYYSPYGFYFGVCAPYIARQHAYYAYPTTVWIDVPVYVNNVYSGWDDDRKYRDDYYLNRAEDLYDPDNIADTSLRDALDDIHDAFRYGSIEHLVNLVDPQVKVAIFLKGKYEYSMPSNDYLDMTRDAMRYMDTIQFDFTRLRKRAMNVYVVSGKHVYKNSNDETRAVYVSFVLEKLKDRWTITQLGTSPDQIQEP